MDNEFLETDEYKARELKKLLDIIEERKNKYSITNMDTSRIKAQWELVRDMQENAERPPETMRRYSLYYWGNGAGKTAIGSYVTSLKSLGRNWTKKYWLPFIGSAKSIWVLTKSGSNVKSTIDPYFLWEWSIARIPPEDIRKVTKDNGILKEILLINWTTIKIFTYDQGRENIQWGNPDFIWLDEEPKDEEIWNEINARMRGKSCEMLITMTPLSWLTPIYSFFLDQKSEEVRAKSKVYIVSSLDNPFIDHTWTKGLTEEEYRLRVLWSFESPTWLVYSSFHRWRNVVADMDKFALWEWVRLYKSIDLWVVHPTWVIFLAQDNDDNFYVYDEIYRQNTLIKDLVKEINKKSWKDQFEYTLRDSAAKREGIELENFGIKTTPADKHSKWENDMSNRRAGIMLINQLLADWKLIISNKCVNLIKEFETHYYKEGGKKDWEVNKINDDLLDALRYIIFNIKKNFKWSKLNIEKKFQRDYGALSESKKSRFVNF